MRKYENQVQQIKSEVLSMVAKYAFEGSLEDHIHGIPEAITPGPNNRFRCCIYHERAITKDRIQMICGGNPDNDNIVEVIDAACDQCSMDRFIVTDTCRGCLAHHCENACPADAITFTQTKAFIDRDKCIECGRCLKACPYSAIIDVQRPCRRSCPTGALTINENKMAVIDNDLCIQCGACVYSCPFGALQEKSSLLHVIDLLKSSQPVYAIIAPAFATQFDYVPLGKVVSALKTMGFKDVVEVALGADFVIEHESQALLAQDTPMTSSCCPGFVAYIKQEYPELVDLISHIVSPMVATGRLIKSIDPQARVVFVGPCIGKKEEAKNYPEDVDFVLTFEELAAMIEAKAINLEALETAPLNNASYYGRKLAKTGGLSEGIQAVLGDSRKTIVQADGIKACDRLLKKMKFTGQGFDFLEGMACEGGCIRGPVTMHYGNQDQKAINNYAIEAKEKKSSAAAEVFPPIKMS